MNALVRKEVRLLLPSWLLGLLLTLVIWLMPNAPDSHLASALTGILVVIPFVVCPVLALMLALSSFGGELSGGTFSFLLAQPIARSRVWWTKTLLLAAALLVMLVVWLASFAVHFQEAMSSPGWKDVYLKTTASLFALVVYSGGLWTVLFFRQVAAAFWFTLLTPAAVLMAVGAAMARLGKEEPEQIMPVVAVVLILYSLAGFFWAWRMFLRAQDVQWTGGAITLPQWRWRGTTRATGGTKPPRPLRELFAKEFRLHESQFVIAGLLALFHLALLATRKFGGDFKSSPVMEFVLEHFWVLWLVMPWLLGSTAVAEERKLGTLEAQLCLPARRRTQFVIKFISTLLLSVLLGAALPVLLEGARIVSPQTEDKLGSYAAIMPGGGMMTRAGEMLAIITGLLPLLLLVGIAAGIGAVSFYASTFSRNTMQAIAPAALGIILACLLWRAASDVDQFLRGPLWRGPLIYVIGVPFMTLAVVGLMYGNFKRVLVGWNVWWRNAVALLGTLAGVIVLTTTLYHRPWELLGALEPAHGVARLKPAEGVQLRGQWLGLSVVLSDGRHWATRLTLSAPQDFVSKLAGDWQVGQATRGEFLEQTNWASVARGFPGMVGIQKDGSLWIADPAQPVRRHWHADQFRNRAPVRLGTDNDWKSVVYQSPPAFLLKTDGTLWRLGTNRMNLLKEWPGFASFTPERLGTDSDWADIFSIEGRMFLRKADGQTWVNQEFMPADKVHMDLNADTRIYRASSLDRVKAPLPHWAFARRGQVLMVGVFDDGSFGAYNSSGRRGFENNEVRLGIESNWVAAAGQGLNVITLKADGSLWKWDFGDDPVARPETASAKRLSIHSDWVAITDTMGGVVALAADGSLWFWRPDEPRRYPTEAVGSPWLRASRRPQLIGNIFASDV